MHYYNEIDSYAADWLENLMAAGLIPEGVVDRRDIRDVRPIDLIGFTSCHFFAGLGGWAYALRLAGWPDDRPVWTGSCPCQPFSAAGKGRGFADERHLWPAWFWLIVQSRPDVIFGEQVDKAVDWLDLVASDLEVEGYRVGAGVLPAASAGAPHGRHRLWFVADTHRRTNNTQLRPGQGDPIETGRGGETGGSNGYVAAGIQGEREQVAIGKLADTDIRLARDGELQRGGRLVQPATDTTAVWLAQSSGAECRVGRPECRGTDCCGPHAEFAGSGDVGELGDPNHSRSQRRRISAERARKLFAGAPGLDSFWGDADWIPCRDGKWRPVEPGTFPLAHGIPNRVGRLRAYGNAIVPQVAAAFIQAYLDC